MIEAAGDTAHDGDRNKHGHQHQGGGDHGRGHLIHGFHGGAFRVHPAFDIVLNRFHHHNRIIHHNTDSQHQSQERQHIDGETDHGEYDKGPHQGNGDGDGGNQRRPPVLNKDENHQNH